MLYATEQLIAGSLVASTGPVLVRCWQHRPSTGSVLAHKGMFMVPTLRWVCSVRARTCCMTDHSMEANLPNFSLHSGALTDKAEETSLERSVVQHGCALNP